MNASTSTKPKTIGSGRGISLGEVVRECRPAGHRVVHARHLADGGRAAPRVAASPGLGWTADRCQSRPAAPGRSARRRRARRRSVGEQTTAVATSPCRSSIALVSAGSSVLPQITTLAGVGAPGNASCIRMAPSTVGDGARKAVGHRRVLQPDAEGRQGHDDEAQGRRRRPRAAVAAPPRGPPPTRCGTPSGAARRRPSHGTRARSTRPPEQRPGTRAARSPSRAQPDRRPGRLPDGEAAGSCPDR